ncbi:hypothetical protein [Mammaliicoccus sciuri]|uniref:hypothetical protein n=1 Tax=Mammaliicoccus sciuri TaxID=1296 RepID=UPI001FB56BAD|nr:hypothetical protein [Mammaliicoccus sciuri]MCJ1765843.1 hypothetical protein [Mammaliicoccus sciuri]MCJ1774675.1 hypothetical protein [Mammaliicoccus sciuri]
MDNQIYIIIYTEYNKDSEVEDVFANEKYFTNKDVAIHELEKEGFKHVCDDEYSDSWYFHAEIMLLFKEDTQ